jgi:hypothetical protein
MNLSSMATFTMVWHFGLEIRSAAIGRVKKLFTVKNAACRFTLAP